MRWLLCLFGFHHWGYWTAPAFCGAAPLRQCDYCPKTQVLIEGRWCDAP
jgi:hypothetical protein